MHELLYVKHSSYPFLPAQIIKYFSESVDASPGRLPSSSKNSWSGLGTSFDAKQPKSGGRSGESKHSRSSTKSWSGDSNEYYNYDVQSDLLTGEFIFY